MVDPNPTRPNPTSPTPPVREPTILSTDQARQGLTTGRVRWILGVSLALAVIAMALSWAL
jgi:hypothetical protein